MDIPTTPQTPKKIEITNAAENCTLCFVIYGVIYASLIITSFSYKNDLVASLYWAASALVLTQVFLEFYSGKWKPWLSASCRIIAVVSAGLIIQANR